jgi:hypothetical protein
MVGRPATPQRPWRLQFVDTVASRHRTTRGGRR